MRGFANMRDLIPPKHTRATRMPRCIAQKENGTQCKRNAKQGSCMCGTHQTWTAIYAPANAKKDTKQERLVWNSFKANDVPTPIISVKYLTSLFDF